MARIKLNPILEEAHGQLGETVFRRAHDGSLSLMKKPDMSSVEWSPAQRAHRRRFRQAVAYARAAMSDPGKQAVYAEAVAQRGKRPFDLAVSDYFHGKELVS